MFGEKLKQLRNDHGLSLDGLAKLYNKRFQGKLNKSTLSRYENELQEPMISVVRNMAELFNVTLDYMLGRTASRTDDELNEMIDHIVSIRYLGEVAAGFNHIAYEEYETLDIPADWLNGRPASDYFAMRVTGSSMYPEYRDGDEILCLACNDMGRSGRVGVIVYGGGEATLKKIEYKYGEDWVDLVPINPEYETKRIEGYELEQCRVIGRAVRLIRTIDQ